MKWSQLDPMFQLMLGNRVQSITAPQRLGYYNQAQDNFASRHTAACRIQSYNGTGTGMTFDLPTDFLDVYAVYWADETMFLEPKDYVPGIEWDVEDTEDTSRPYGYILWPQSQLTVFHAPEVGTGNLTLYYWGLYAEAEAVPASPSGSYSEPELEPPVWAYEAILTYAVALSLIPDLQDTANVRQWNTRTDSGRPEDNPLGATFDRLVKHYHELLSTWPKQVRTQAYRSGGRSV